MPDYMQAIWLSAAAGVVGTGLGGLWSLLPVKTGQRLQAAAGSFVCGMMMAVTALELLPEALGAGKVQALLALASGCLIMWGMQMMLEGKNAAGYITLLVIMLHNFPEGIAIGAGYCAAPQLGAKLALTIALHDVPEGVAAALPLKKSGMKAAKVTALCILAGAATVVGAAAGSLLCSGEEAFIPLALGFAAGAMLWAACGSIDGGRGEWKMAGFMMGAVAVIMV